MEKTIFTTCFILIGAILAVVTAGYIFNIEILTRGGFEGFPIMRVTTLAQFIILSFAFFSLREVPEKITNCHAVFRTLVFADWVFILAICLFILNARGLGVGLESLFYEMQFIEPSQGTQIATFFLAITIFGKLQNLPVWALSLTLAVPFVLSIGAIIGQVFGVDAMYFLIENRSYGVSVPTAICFLLYSISFAVYLNK